MEKSSRPARIQSTDPAIDLRNFIYVRGAREHNLKNINVTLPRNRMIVVTGLSGSGKSSLAFDTIYAEGQRRYVESLSVYSRQFLEQLKKPDVDALLGLSPAIAIDQKTTVHNPRSTVGTVTEVYDFLRLLFARIGTPHCPVHETPVQARTPHEIVAEILAKSPGQKFSVLAPVVRGEKGEFKNEFQQWAGQGLVRARVDGEWYDLSAPPKLAKTKKHDIDLLLDRLVVSPEYSARLLESVELSLNLAEGLVAFQWESDQQYQVLSVDRACGVCGFSFPELEPRLFSFNNPRGACPSCSGLGFIYADEMIEDSFDDDAEVVPQQFSVCAECEGARLNVYARQVWIAGYNIADVACWPLGEVQNFLQELVLNPRELQIAQKIIEQIHNRLGYMIRVGTGYLSLDRTTQTLSGGEVQRLRLAAQVGSALIGILYVLDEPSIGLHPRDHQRLLEILKEVRDRGNTVLIVEHDDDTINMADYVIDMGPGAGHLGGQVMAAGSPAEIKQNPNSLTGRFLSGSLMIAVPAVRRVGNSLSLQVKGASGNNLKNVDLSIPLGCLVGISGVSGSGKSTLIMDTLYRILGQHFNSNPIEPARYGKVVGLEHIDKAIHINQRPIGRTPRSIPATYVGLYGPIRDLFSRLPEAQLRGFKPGDFSFNVKGGRCEVCQGGGQVRVEMNFLADVYVTCDACMGQRYNAEVLSVRYRDRNISEVLNMSCAEAVDFFKNHRTIAGKLETLCEVGLGYIRLGQSSTTLSGGEAQRIKLSRELSKKATGKSIYILDEPTTGLHFEDIRNLVALLGRLVDSGNTVIVIEHNLDVLKVCDHLIDLGPEGGEAGGEILVSGTPEQVAGCKASHTGRFLKLKLSH